MKAIVKDEKRVNRRDSLMVALFASLTGLFGQAGIALFNFFKPRSEPGSFGSIVNAGRVEEFKPGTVSHISTGRLYISRLEDGGFLAIWQRCTHLGCSVPWREEEGQFNCPCHSSIFTPLGEVVSGPAPRPMDLFQIEIVEAAILVDTSRLVRRERFDPSQVTYP